MRKYKTLIAQMHVQSIKIITMSVCAILFLTVSAFLDLDLLAHLIAVVFFGYNFLQGVLIKRLAAKHYNLINEEIVNQHVKIYKDYGK